MEAGRRHVLVGTASPRSDRPADARRSPVRFTQAYDGGVMKQKSWLARSLSLFTEVHPGEGGTALLLAANLFCLFALYYVLKPVRESLILSESGAVIKSYAAAGQALLLLGLVPAYGAVASRVSRVPVIALVTLFFASNLIVFYLFGIAGVRVGVAFYLWLGIFNLMVPSQMWAFA